jgi:hypothetical protein
LLAHSIFWKECIILTIALKIGLSLITSLENVVMAQVSHYGGLADASGIACMLLIQ